MKKLIVFLSLVTVVTINVAQNNQQQFDKNGLVERALNLDQTSIDNLNPLKAGNEWSSIGPYGGDVLDIAVYPIDPNIVFAAAGIPYVSYDGGETWEFIEELANFASVIESFEASSNGTIYASGPYSYYKIFRSTDGGETWEQKSIPVNGAGLDIAVDPNDPDIVYVGLSSIIGGSSNNVIIKSEDGGDSWTYFNMTSVLPIGWSVVNLTVDPEDSQVIFAIGNEGLSNAAVVATFDGGTTWENRTGNLPFGKPYNSLTISEQDVYIAGGQLFGGQTMGIYKTENYGQSWENISNSFPNNVSNAILIDPSNTNKMYVASEGDGIYYTVNGGITWNYNTAGAGDNGSARSLTFEPGNTDVIYAGFLSLAVCKSSNASQSWDFSNKGIATLQTDDVEVNPIDAMNFLVGFEAENSGGCYLSNDGGNSWQLVQNLPGTRFSQVTFGADETMYAWSNGPTTVGAEGLYKSSDGGQTWLNTGPNIGSVFETQIFALAASTTDPDLLFIGGNNFGANGWESMIYRTTDGGENWVNVYMGPEMDSFKYLFIDPNSNDLIIYTGFGNQSDHAGFIKSIDGGDVWDDINSGIPSQNKWCGAIVCDPANSDIIYAGVGGYGNVNGTMYKSIDAGTSFTGTGLSLQSYSKISDIVISPLNSDVVYIASTQDGVYLSTDAGISWGAANDGLPATNVTGFSNSFMVDDVWYFTSSTFSNSAFKTEIYDPGTTGKFNTSINNEELSLYPNPAKDHIFIKTNQTRGDVLQVRILSSTGRLIKEVDNKQISGNIIPLDLNLKSGVYTFIIDTESGQKVERIIIVN